VKNDVTGRDPPPPKKKMGRAVIDKKHDGGRREREEGGQCKSREEVEEREGLEHSPCNTDQTEGRASVAKEGEGALLGGIGCGVT